jgi:Predicted pPIWI-associating nuclease
MQSNKAAINQSVEELRDKNNDQFSNWAIDGALSALSGSENPLRLNFFSTAMRILFEHIMDTRSPEDHVVRAAWFKAQKPSGKPTRWQRVIFAIQGGLSESLVKDELKIDLPGLRKRLLGAVDELSKHVHGRENTIIRDLSEQDAVVAQTVAAMGAFLDALHECRQAVLKPIAGALDRGAIDALLSETLLEVDELATHHSVEEIYVDDINVTTIGVDSITYRVSGEVGVTLQRGSNSDVRRGDGAEVEQSFPFQCEFELPLEDPWDLDLAELSYRVDTSKWRDAMAPDE